MIDVEATVAELRDQYEMTPEQCVRLREQIAQTNALDDANHAATRCWRIARLSIAVCVTYPDEQTVRANWQAMIRLAPELLGDLHLLPPTLELVR